MKKGAILAVFAVLLAVSFVEAQNLLPKARGHMSALHRGIHRQDPAAAAAAAATVPELWFHSQKLDHYDPENSRVWSQRYFLNDTFWTNKQNPVFLILGGEGPAKASDVVNHFVISQYAQSFGALVISVEHRFYGKSQPTGSTSTSDLKYLSSQQALADYALFQNYITETFGASGKWIVFGGSYSGNLAAWYRLKYPHLATGAIASSAPVQALLDFTAYLVTVGDALTPACYSKMQSATNTIESMLTTASGRASLETIFSTCDPITTDPNDLAFFMESLIDPICGIVQYNNDNNNYQPFNAATMCNIFLNAGSDPVQSLATLLDQTYAFSGQNCTGTNYEKYIKELSVTLPVDTAGRCWTWQTCTEFGYYQTGESPQQPFSSLITLEFFENTCRDAFQFDFLPNTNWTNNFYGSTNIRGTRIVFPNGSVDPWHNLGVLEAPNGLETPIFINGTAHCADLYPPSPNDVPGLTQARQIEFDHITAWLK